MDLRIKRIYAELKKANLDGLIISSPANITYLTNFISCDSYLLISKKQNIYITDSRYIEEAKNNLDNAFALKKIDGSVFELIAGTCQRLKLKRVGFEERYLPFGEHKKIKEILGKTLHLIPTYGLIEALRQIKSPQELKKIKKAIRITIDALRFIEGFISVGKKETEVAAELERFIRYNGGRACAFDIIVASGPNSSFPHHITSQRKIGNHEPVLVDLGVDYMGYKSDLTRVFFSGKITSLIRRIYDIILQAQYKAINRIKPDGKINKLDAASRQYITLKGYGKFFVHNLGHGVGLEVHEEPHICAKENKKLKPGMVFTIEPGIYLPNKFGIRIEDMVLVTEKGVELLSADLNK